MDLKNMLLPEKVVTFDFPGCEGFTVDLAFLSKESHQVLYKKCQKQRIDMRTRQTIEDFDDEMYLKLYVKACVRGWKGFKMKYIKELVLVEIEDGQEEKTLPFSDENALDLMKSSTAFDNWVSEVIVDLGKFTSEDSTGKSKELKII